MPGWCAAAAVSETALPEREPHAACFEGFLALLEALPGDHWAEVYVRWELALLAEKIYGKVKSTGGVCLDDGKSGQMVFQFRADLHNHVVG